MQNDMKKNHLHPSNPHRKGTLAERIEDYYAKDPNAHLRTVATELKITDWQLLDAYENAIAIPVSDFPAVYEQLSTLDHVLLHADTGSVLLQVETKLPPPVRMRGTTVLKTTDHTISLTSLLFEESFYALFLVREALYGKESLSLAIVDEDEKICLSIYLPHDQEKNITHEAKELFELLWNQYKSKENL
jgi:putative heme iron utilization protein